MSLLELIEAYPEYVWLTAGALLISLEAFAAPGIGFLFTGLAAITVGAMVGTGLVGIDKTWAQFGWFFLFTTLWGAALWKPLKKWRMRSTGPTYRNLQGQTATVLDTPLLRGKRGRVKWSGTVMDAKLDANAPVEQIGVGEEVEVLDVQGNRLLVTKPGASTPTEH